MIRRIAPAVALALTLLCGCGSPSGAPTSPATGSPGAITVFAAASLRSAFTEIGDQFTADNPGAAVQFSFAGSSDLVTQLTQGAHADVFASADTRNMDKAARAGLLDSAPVDFASNTLTIVTAPGNPKAIETFGDLADPGLAVVVCAEPVPCGAATKRLQEATGVVLTPVSEETSVTDVLNKVTAGQADAGVVYVTDAAAAKGKVAEVAVPEAAGVVNTYPIAVLDQSENKTLAGRFVAAVTGATGQKVLAAHGFATP